MTRYNLRLPRLSKIYDQESLTLRWHSLSWWGRQCLNLLFAHRGSQYYVYVYVQLVGPEVTKETWPKLVIAPLMLICMTGQGTFHGDFSIYTQPIRHISLYDICCPAEYPDSRRRIVDAPLTLIRMMWHAAFQILNCPWRHPILRWWLCATCWPPGYPTFMTKNHWRSIKTHFHDRAGSVSLCVLPVKAANSSFMSCRNLWPHRLSKIHVQESLTLPRRSFCDSCIHNLQSIDLA